MHTYSKEGIDLARVIRRCAVGERQAGDATTLTELADVCQRRALEAASGGRRKVDLESEIQALLVAALNSDVLQYPLPGSHAWGVVLVHHSPLGGGRSQREGAELKRNGARAGWPDLDIRLVTVNGVLWSLLLELKAPGGRLSAEQKKVHERLDSVGFLVRTSVGLEAAVAVVSEVLGG